MASIYFLSFLIITILISTYIIIKLTRFKNSFFTKALLVIILLLAFLGCQIIYNNSHLQTSSAFTQQYSNAIIKTYLSSNVLNTIPVEYVNLANILKNSSSFSPTSNNSVTILENGQTTYDNLFTEIKNAKHYIHIEDFMMKTDSTSKAFSDLLINKSKEGVKVRLLFDGMGSTIKRKELGKLKAAGIEVIIKNRLLSSLLRGQINNRDHRKIFIIDGTIAFTGGINIGDEYLGKDLAKGFWRDIDIKLTGDSVKQLQCIFLSNWYLCTGQNLIGPEYYPPAASNHKIATQVVSGDPGSTFSNIELLYSNMINSAQSTLYITSPYLILNDVIYNALACAKFRGVDVKIMIPSKPDEGIAYKSALYYANKLASLGIEIYTYQNGYIHSKTMTADGKIASVGTANLNNRSIYLDYEDCVVIYDSSVSASLNTSFLNDLKKCAPFDVNSVKKRGISSLVEKIAVILSPIQ